MARINIVITNETGGPLRRTLKTTTGRFLTQPALHMANNGVTNFTVDGDPDLRTVVIYEDQAADSFKLTAFIVDNDIRANYTVPAGHDAELTLGGLNPNFSVELIFR